MSVPNVTPKGVRINILSLKKINELSEKKSMKQNLVKEGIIEIHLHVI